MESLLLLKNIFSLSRVNQLDFFYATLYALINVSKFTEHKYTPT